ncbi:MAG TPA: 30S ribosomal protein S8 [Nitrospiria bacterium]|nr:30S ribosomal protein S8 [Nitrospiria bacterium]HUK57546.1 30S ribosomal protein S8 [Nitrospiria bacterium]
MMTDPISDMLNRMRNAIQRKYESVDIPASKLKQNIARLLAEEGYIRGIETVSEGRHPVLRIKLKYAKDVSIINGMRRISRPGRRVYVDKDGIPKVRGGLGTAVMSTTQGMMTDRESRKRQVGGEVICYIW